MRIFIALPLPPDTKAEIAELISNLKASAMKGRFVEADLLHITVEFLGEITPLPLEKVNQIVDGLDFNPFRIRLTQIGIFHKPSGDIWWLGVEPGQDLLELQSQLHNLLKEQGFHLEERPYRPHITLGRKVELKDKLDPSDLTNFIQAAEVSIREILVMKSEIINGKLTYTPIHTHPAKTQVL